MEFSPSSISHSTTPLAPLPSTSSTTVFDDDDWYQMDGGMTGNNVNWTDPDFFAQFDGSTQYHDVEMGEPEHFAMPELTTSQLAPTLSTTSTTSTTATYGHTEITPLPSTPYHPVETHSGERPRPLVIQSTAHVTPSSPPSIDIPFADLTPPGVGRASTSPVILSPRPFPYPRQYQVAQQTPPVEMPRYSSSSIERLPRKEPEKKVEDAVTWADIRQELTPESLALDRPVKLFTNLRRRTDGSGADLDPKFVPVPSQVSEILVALKEHASHVYLRKVGDEMRYIALFKTWLIQATKDVSRWASVLPNLFDVLARMDIPVNYIQELKIGTRAKKVVSTAEAIRPVLRNLSQIQSSFDRLVAWIKDTLLPKNRTHFPPEKEPIGTERVAKKRKVDEPSASEITRPGPSQPAPTIKKPPPVSDSSFFQKPITPSVVPKPKNRLPEFRKKDPLPASPPLGSKPIPTPEADPVNSLLQKLNYGQIQAQKPMVSSAASSAFTPRPPPRRPNRKGHTVRFRDSVPDAGVLETVRHFKQEPHELEPAPWSNIDGVSGDNVAEGEALRVHGEMDEEVEWFEPLEFIGAMPIPATTPECQVQENRERGVLASSEILSTPSDLAVDVVSTGPRTGKWQPIMIVPPKSTGVAVTTMPNYSQLSALMGSLDPSFPRHGQGYPGPHWTKENNQHQPYSAFDHSQSQYGAYSYQTPQQTYNPPSYDGRPYDYQQSYAPRHR